MKKLYILFTLLFIFQSVNVHSQWILQGLGYELPNGGPGKISIASQDVVWTGFSGVGQGIPLNYCRTTNGGVNWSFNQIPGYQDYKPIYIEAIDANIAWIYATPTTTTAPVILLKTINGGQNWIPVTSTSLDTIEVYYFHFYSENEGFAAGMTPGGNFFFAKTNDSGLTWIPVNPAFIPNSFYYSELISNFYSDKIYMGDKIFIATTNGRLLISEDKGLHWVAKNTPLTSSTMKSISCIFMDSTHGVIYCNTNGEFAETFNKGINWQQFSPIGPVFNNISYVPGTVKTLVSSGQHFLNGMGGDGCSFSVDGGHTWTDYPEFYGEWTGWNSFFDSSTGWVGVSTTLPSPPQTGIYKFTGNFTEILETDPRKGGVTLYPNPTQGNVNAIIIGFEGKEILFKLANYLGQTVYSEQFTQNLIQSERSFDLGDIARGVYVATFEAGDKVITKKVVIQ